LKISYDFRIEKSENYSTCRATLFHSIYIPFGSRKRPIIRSLHLNCETIAQLYHAQICMVFLETQHIHHRSLPASVLHVERLISIRNRERGGERERERERESLLNAPSCKRNTYRYETNDTTTLINSDECVYNIGFVISRVHIRFRARINIRRAALAGPVAALLRAYKFK